MKIVSVVAMSLLAGLGAPAFAQEQDPATTTAPKKENDGTDPTQLSTSADTTLEHVDLRNGFDAQTLAMGISIPVGTDKQTAIKLRVPFDANDVLGNDSLGLGDISIKATRVLTVKPKYGIVVSGELVFDTASRTELGSGKTVFKASFVYANFLKGGNIFAPALVHSTSVAGSDARGDINTTTLDLYVVPRLKNKKLFMTIDPAFTYNWENEAKFGSLAITFGYKLGKMFGGNGQVFVKPSVLIGSDRGANWGTQVGFKVLNF